MARFFSTILFVAAVAVASTRATAVTSDDDALAAKIEALKSEVTLLESVQALKNMLKEKATVAVTGLSTESSTIAVAAFASGSKAGSHASSPSVGSGNDDFDIEPIPTAAPAATKATPAVTSKPTGAPAADSGSKGASTEVKTPTPSTSGASTLAPMAAAVVSIAVYAML